MRRPRPNGRIFAAGSVDLITAAQAVHWFDLPRFYMEARRVARPRGVIAILGYGVTVVDGPLGAIVDDFYSRVLDRWWPPERKHIETGYRHLDFPFAELEPPEIEMAVQWSVDQLLGYVSTWSAVRGMEKAEGPAAMERFSAGVREAWGSGKTRRVSWPLVMRVGRV